METSTKDIVKVFTEKAKAQLAEQRSVVARMRQGGPKHEEPVKEEPKEVSAVPQASQSFLSKYSSVRFM